jgi:fructose-specific phosphotransferase system component IIB
MADKIKKDVSLIGRDFGSIRTNLIDFTKNYFPQTYNDFNEASPGMMMMEIASYVGDVLSYYTDVQLRESLLEQAQEKKNVFAIAQSLGYKPKLNVPATSKLSMYQLVPAIGSGANVRPDFRYALTLQEGAKVTAESDGDIAFTTNQKVRFNYSSSFDPTEVSVYQIDDNTNLPVKFLLKKYVQATSGKEKVETYTFGSPKIYDKIRLKDEDGLIDVIKIMDSEGDEWTKVDYLGQDTVFEESPNTSEYSLKHSAFASETPALLKLKKVPKRYITRVTDEGEIEIQFGAGVSSNADEELLPNPDNVGSSLYNATGNLNQGLDPSNFLYSKTYGVAPANTTLSVTYRISKGVIDNVVAQDLNKLANVVIETTDIGLDGDLFKEAKKSIAVSNEVPAMGGKFEETMDEVRENAKAYFGAQARAVTREDYVVRAYAMPPQFGSISKAFVAPDFQIQTLLDDGVFTDTSVSNPLAINFYVLGYDSNKKLALINNATKTNLLNYMSFYRILTDAINIKNAYIVNIAIDFELVVKPNFNANEVLLNCIAKLKNYFAVDKIGINQPILLSDLYVMLDEVDGVQSVVRPNALGEGGLQIINKDGGQYSPRKYNIKNATKKGIVYPPKDPSVFEIKFPDIDIRGRVVPLF